MATIRCPRCDARVPACERWAQVVVATMIAAPAVPDMATQVRCPNCHHLFAESEIRHTYGISLRGVLRSVFIAAAIYIGWLALALALN